MRVLIACVLLAAFLAPTEALAERSGITIYGPGTTQCHTWTSDQAAAGGEAYVEKIWVLGFMSAYNNYMVKNKPGLTTDDATSFFTWIDQYCAANTSDTLAVATAKLVEHLKGD